MSVWVSVLLGELVEVKGGKRLPLGHKLQIEKNSAPYIRIVDFDGGIIDQSKMLYVPTQTQPLIERYRVAHGDVCISIVGTVGVVGVIPKSLDGAFLTENAAKLTSFEPVLNASYLSHVLRSSDGQNSIREQTVGSTQPKLALHRIREISIPLPPIGVQKAIAEVLGALDDKIAANTKLVQTSDELAGVLTRRALDFENRVPLSSVAQVTMGSSPPGVTLNEVGAGEVFYQGVRDFGVRFPVNRVWTTGPVRFAEKLDTLLSVRAPVGRANLAQERTCIGRGIASIRSIEAHPYSIFHRLRDDPEMWAPYEAEGTVFGSINRGQLDKLAMPAILADDSDRLEAQLAAIELRVASALAENCALAATRDALLPQLMSGKLRVRDAEKAVQALV